MKKKISIYIFIIFPVAGNEKKKEMKKNCAEPFLCYYPNYIVKKKIVLQASNCIAEKKKFEG